MGKIALLLIVTLVTIGCSTNAAENTETLSNETVKRVIFEYAAGAQKRFESHHCLPFAGSSTDPEDIGVFNVTGKLPLSADNRQYKVEYEWALSSKGFPKGQGPLLRLCTVVLQRYDEGWRLKAPSMVLAGTRATSSE